MASSSVVARELGLDGDTKRLRDADLPAEYPDGDDDEASKYAKYSKALWEEQEGGLEQLHRTWTQNLLYLAGYQWWRFDRLTGTFRPENVPKWRERPVTNLLVPFFKHFIAKVTKQRPAHKSVPASTDPEDIHSANLADDALRAKWQELRLSRMLRRAIAWCVPTGNAYILPFWNTETGNLRPLTAPVEAMKIDPDTGAVVGAEIVECPCDEEGNPRMTEDGRFDVDAEPTWVDEGELGAKVLSPFQVRVDPGAETDEEMMWVMIGEVSPIRDIRRRWPELGNIVSEDLGLMERYDALVTGLGVNSMHAGADTHIVGGSADRDDQIPKALVLYYYERPSPEYPAGRYWVTVGNDLAEEPQPLPDGIWPVIHHMKDLEVPGRYHGVSTFEAVVGLQREYNEVNALIKEHHSLMLRGKWLVPIGSNIRRGQITQQPGEVIQHTPGLPPKMAELKPLPTQVYQERERILADFERISGLMKISMGEPPPGVTSGRAFLTLQEADDTDYGPFIAMLEETVAALAWSFLQLMQERYDEERLIYIVGEDRRYQVRAFRGADLGGVVDVVPEAGSAFPWSSVAKQNMLIEIAQTPLGQQLFVDPQTGMFDKRRFTQLLPVAGLDALYDDADIDYNEAMREEEEFELFQGDVTTLPRVLPWQDHTMHLRVHTKTLKSAGFQRWEPAAQEAFINHWRETQAAMDQELLKQLAQQAVAEGRVQVPGMNSPGGGSEASGTGEHPMERAEMTERETAAGLS